MLSFTLLDDNQASATHPTSRLYTNLQQVLSCTDRAQFASMIEQMQAALQQGLYAVAVFSYELGAQLHPHLYPHLHLYLPPPAEVVQPSYILLYQQCQWLSSDQVNDWLQQQSTDPIAGIANLRSSVSEKEFHEAIHRIQRYIEDGDTYQVNYTFRLHFQTYGTIFSLYQRLRARQSVPFGALITLPDGSTVLSLSPELFIRHNQGNLETRPMKGTLAALTDNDEKANTQINLERSTDLSLDEKNRAENVMIVDLLRNDLGRIAQAGSVQVPKLFEVQRFNTVLQMTSSVVARCRQGVSLADVLQAVYPCGSITGAPKIRAMQIINEVETEARGIYTSAIGWFDPSHDQTPLPEFCLSVPIRTLHLHAPEADQIRSGVMGVGAGIVFDSVAAHEYQECLLKARFLTELPPQFALFETMYATKEHGCRYWQRHLNRLTNSARYFGMPLNVTEIEQKLKITFSELANDTPYRLKLSIDGLGKIHIHYVKLETLKTPVNVVVAIAPQSSYSIWLQHKTTQRAIYDQAWQTAEQQGAFDMLFCNERGELTEGARSNVLVKIDGSWYTPPLSAGVLPGVMRSVLMDDPRWKLTERSIRIEQLHTVQEIAICNALRGVLPVILCEELTHKNHI